jgi:hypothetical protein
MEKKIIAAYAVLTALTSITASAAVVVGWNTSTQTGGVNNFGTSPLAASTSDANITVTTGLTRGSGAGTTGTGAARGWGGNDWQTTSTANAIAGNDFISFSLTAASGQAVSYTGFDLSYRRSATGPNTGTLEYQIGSGAFNTISSPISYSSSANSGATLSTISLSGISALQGVQQTVTFRLSNFGGSNATGTWYVFDVANTTANDLFVSGTFATAVPEPSEYAGMAGAGLIGFAVWRRRSVRKA